MSYGQRLPSEEDGPDVAEELKTIRNMGNLSDAQRYWIERAMDEIVRLRKERRGLMMAMEAACASIRKMMNLMEG